MTPQFSQQDFLFLSLDVSNGAGVERALYFNVCHKLEKLVEGKFESPSAVGGAIGEPDIVFHSQGTLLLVIEVKTRGLLPRVDSLANKFNEDIEVIKQDCVPVQSTISPIGQIFGYLSHNKLQFGVLTTYQQTWFLRRDRSKLYVSPTIDYNNQSPTLLQCYFWIIKQATQEPLNETAQPVLPLSPQQ